MALATSKNLTVLGVCTIVAALVSAAVALFDGDPATNIDLNALFVAILSGVGNILAKGAATTGGTVDPAGVPVAVPPATP